MAGRRRVVIFNPDPLAVVFPCDGLTIALSSVVPRSCGFPLPLNSCTFDRSLATFEWAIRLVLLVLEPAVALLLQLQIAMCFTSNRLPFPSNVHLDLETNQQMSLTRVDEVD